MRAAFKNTERSDGWMGGREAGSGWNSLRSNYENLQRQTYCGSATILPHSEKVQARGLIVNEFDPGLCGYFEFSRCFWIIHLGSVLYCTIGYVPHCFYGLRTPHVLCRGR